MNRKERPQTIEAYFAGAIKTSLHQTMGLPVMPDVDRYLVGLLTGFLHQDHIFSIRDASGHRVMSVSEMLEYGDIRLKADSFEKERQVHRHIGDFLLFWSGVFPEFLPRLAGPGSKDMLLDCRRQGSFSYHIASTFDHPPHEAEARILKQLSENFPAYQHGLSLVRASFEGFRLQGWFDGFQA